jgi:alginate O-acetyltransferase complex protein AlgI
VQIYADFSGYTDIAIGIALLLGIRFPQNFDRPYAAESIQEFWRCWHMTLSRWLRDYLYIPLGGNQKGRGRTYVNLMVTMLLGGLWHGASWTFVFWGGLHGLYLAINHGFRAVTAPIAAKLDASKAFAVASWGLTLLAVVVAWVFFRAPTFASAGHILAAMVTPTAPGGLPETNPLLWNAGLDLQTGLVTCLALGAIAVFAPNSNRIGEVIRDACERAFPRRAALLGGATMLAVLLVVLNEVRESVSAFIYFNF